MTKWKRSKGTYKEEDVRSRYFFKSFNLHWWISEHMYLKVVELMLEAVSCNLLHFINWY